MLYVKENQIENGYMLKKADGSIVLNASKEEWLAEGWKEWKETKPQQQEEFVRSIFDVRNEVLQECENYYKSVVLKVEFQRDLIWIPLETRAAYRVILDDLKEKGETQVTWKNVNLSIEFALEALKKVNIYEYECKKVHDSHLRNITKSQSTGELEEYDYTAGYPSGLIL